MHYKEEKFTCNLRKTPERNKTLKIYGRKGERNTETNLIEKAEG
jgi:hypothetical protein